MSNPKNKIWLLFFILALVAAFCWQKQSNRAELKKQIQQQESKSPWPVYRADTSFSGVSQERILSLPLKLLWKFPTKDEVKSSPVINQGMLFIGSNDGRLYALKTKDGQKIWDFSVEGRIEAAPFLLEDKVYFGSSEGKVYAMYAQTGKLLWSYETQGKILASANSFVKESNSYILAGSYDNFLYSIHAISGELLWKYETESYVNGSAVLWEKDKAVLGGCDAHLHILSLQEGKPTGKIKLAAHIGASPAVEGNVAFVGHYAGGFACIDLVEQKILWEYKSSGSKSAFLSSPAIAQDRVLVCSRDGFCYCFHKKTGEKIWAFRTKGEIDSSPVVWENRVVFGSGDGRLYIVSLEKGNLIESHEIGFSIASSPAIAEGKIFIGCDDGYVYAFGNDAP
ncbi:MAG: PQQ-binding-like beta-propeller repeat protein [Candidatus Brocadiae bacterium]|nr:PQQ-binding-like beta-propeller repeat protein [Candidatus Brocadiia bacterium]